MKKLSLICAAILFSAVGWGQVSNPSIIPVQSAPSGPCTQNLPDQQVIGTGALYSCQNGTWAEISGGGGSSPATPFQSPQINQQGTLGSQQNVYIAWSGDTLSSLSTVCAENPTTIELSTALTLSPTEATALPNNCNVSFPGNGEFINSTAFPITINGFVTGPPVQHFARTSTGGFLLGPLNPQLPIEWYGAVGGATLPSTDSTTAIQDCLNSIYAGQCYGQAFIYEVTGALSITRSRVGFHGVAVGRGQPTVIETTSPTADILDIAGTNSTTLISFNKFNDFTLARSVLATGTTDKGLSLNYVGGAIIDDVASNDSHYDFYYHDAPGYGNGITKYTNAGFTNASETSGNWYHYYVDSADGNGSASIQFLHANSSNNTGNFTQTTYCFAAVGEAINDLTSNELNCANDSYGAYLNYTGSGNNIATSDVHFWNSVIDGTRVAAIYTNGITAATSGSVEFCGGWASPYNSTGAIADFESSYGITLCHMKLVQHDYSQTLTAGVEANNSNAIILANNQFLGINAVSTVLFNNTNDFTITGNSITGVTGHAATNMIYLNGTSSFGSVTSNTLSGYATNGITAGASTVGNTGFSMNAVDPTNITTPIADSGATNYDLSRGGVVGLKFYGGVSITSAQTTTQTLLSALAGSLANGAHASFVFGEATSTNNAWVARWENTSAGSTSNYLETQIDGATGDNLDFWPNASVTIGQTSGAAGPANGIAVGTTGQFSVTGAGIPILPHFIVSALPAVPLAGGMVVVTDASTFTPGTCTGGGSDTVLAISNGTSWVCQ